MDESQTPTPALNETVAEESNSAVQPTAETTTSEAAPEATAPAPAADAAQADEPKLSNAEKRQERTRKAFSELLAGKKAVEAENQQLKAGQPADTAKTTPPVAQAPVEPPTLQASGQDGEITAKDIETYSKAMSEYTAQAAVKPLQAENEQLKQLLEQTQGNVNQLSVAEVQKQDTSDARDIVDRYEILNKDKPEVYDESLEQDLLSKFNALRQTNPSLRLKEYFEAEMGALEEYAERIANSRNTQQEKLAAEAPVQTEGASPPPNVKSLHWKDMEKKIGFA